MVVLQKQGKLEIRNETENKCTFSRQAIKYKIIENMLWITGWIPKSSLHQQMPDAPHPYYGYVPKISDR
jgi:hypothetical protein